MNYCFEEITTENLLSIDGGFETTDACKLIVSACAGLLVSEGVTAAGAKIGGEVGAVIGGPVGAVGGAIVGAVVGAIVADIIID